MNLDRIHFGPFLLDCRRATLERGGAPLRIRPKTLAVLTHLARRPGELVERDALLAAVWLDVHVASTVLKVCVHELRVLLGDDAGAPRFIESVWRRGYRFVADVRVDAGGEAPPQPIVGRRRELEQLENALDQVGAGHRQIVFVAGEPGIGKTTLVELFAARTAARTITARGQCIERHGELEPFLPLLDAMGGLCRGREGERMLALLRRHAPSWLLQIPGLIDAVQREELRREYAGATAQRMVLELVLGLERIAAEVPIALLLEDLHWADSSTLEVLAALGRRREPAPLLVVATLRRGGGPADNARLAAVIGELSWHQQATQIELAGLSDGDVAELLAQRFPGFEERTALAELLRTRTAGNPLFLGHVLDRLCGNGTLHRRAGSWRLSTSIEALQGRLPDTLAQALHMRIADLTAAQIAVLEAAGVAGAEFAAASLAGALEREAAEVEEICADLADHRHLLRFVGPAQWSRGATTACFSFAHDAHRTLFYERIPAGRRRLLHRRIGETLEAAANAGGAASAGALASHFELGGDTPRAAAYHLAAGREALGRHAYTEAAMHLGAGLQGAASIAATAERERLELALNAELGVALINSRGFAAPEVKRCYDRALELCVPGEGAAELFPVLEGLHSYYAVVGDLEKAHNLAARMLDMARGAARPAWLVEAHHTSGCVQLRRARIDDARRHLKEGLRLYSAEASAVGIRYCGHDPKVCCLGNLGAAEWFAGNPDRGLGHARAGLRHAARLGHPYSLALAEQMVAWLHLSRGEGEAGLRHADSSLALAADGGFAHIEIVSSLFRAWALALLGRGGEAVDLALGVRDILAALMPMSVELGGMLATVLSLANRPADARALAARALADIECGGPHYLHAHLLWLRGEIQLAAGCADAAIADLERARTLARRQGLASLELPPTLTLSRLWRDGGAPRRAQRRLRACRLRFEAGCETAILAQTDRRLAELEAELPARAATT